jgi:predicted NAD-dependent protein-ADP-ribosyltransferase YbiA (DUF1768 family)
MSIRFYSTKDAYGEFSNFASFPFDLDGMRWPTTEHYFQAQKFHDRFALACQEHWSSHGSA